jgi:antitoxin ParD1/3/4
MGKNTSISLGEHFEDFIQREIANGRYSSASELVRTALRLLEAEENKVKIIRQALEDGEVSGFIENFDREKHLQSLHLKHIKVRNIK